MHRATRLLLATLVELPWLAVACGGESHPVQGGDDAASSNDASFAIDASVDSPSPPDVLDGAADAAPYVRFCDSPDATPYRYCIDFDDPKDPIPFNQRNVSPHATLDVDPTTSMSAPNSAVMETPYVVPGGPVIPGLDGGPTIDASDDFDAGWGPDASPRDLGRGLSFVNFGLLDVGPRGVSSQLDVRLDSIPPQLPAESDPAWILGQDLGSTTFFLHVIPDSGAQSSDLEVALQWYTAADGGAPDPDTEVVAHRELLPVAEGLALGVWTRLVVEERFSPIVGAPSGHDAYDLVISKAVPPGSTPHEIFAHHEAATYMNPQLFFGFGLSTYPHSAPHRAHFDNFLIRDLP